MCLLSPPKFELKIPTVSGTIGMSSGSTVPQYSILFCGIEVPGLMKMVPRLEF